MLKTSEADQVMSLAMRLPLQLYSHFCSLGCPIVCDMSVSKNVKTLFFLNLQSPAFSLQSASYEFAT